MAADGCEGGAAAGGAAAAAGTEEWGGIDLILDRTISVALAPFRSSGFLLLLRQAACNASRWVASHTHALTHAPPHTTPDRRRKRRKRQEMAARNPPAGAGGPNNRGAGADGRPALDADNSVEFVVKVREEEGGK